MKNRRSIKEIKYDLDKLTDRFWISMDQRVRDAIDLVKNENASKVAALEAELAAARRVIPVKKPRWPENTPEDVLEECKEYWRGSTEYHTFRIHCWNDAIVCTGYPNGGYSDNGGWHPTPARFYFLSRREIEYNHAKTLRELEGRQSAKQLIAKMEELSI